MIIVPIKYFLFNIINFFYTNINTILITILISPIIILIYRCLVLIVALFLFLRTLKNKDHPF